jgi:hypothetical protein
MREPHAPACRCGSANGRSSVSAALRGAEMTAERPLAGAAPVKRDPRGNHIFPPTVMIELPAW